MHDLNPDRQLDDASREDLLAEIRRLRKALADHKQGESEESQALIIRRMCDNLPDMLWAKDCRKNYLFANKALCDGLLSAQDTNEPLGRTDLFFATRERELHSEDAQWHTFGEICMDSDEEVLRRGAPGRFQEFGTVKGEFLFLDVHKAPLRDESGKIIGTVGCARDVTQARRYEEELRRSERRFKTIFTTTDIPIWEEDFSHIRTAIASLKTAGVADVGRYLREHPVFFRNAVKSIQVLNVNRALLGLFKAASKEQLVENLDRILLPETARMMQDLFVAIAEGRPRFEGETVARDLHGHKMNLLVRLSLPREMEEYDHLLFCLLDVTAHKKQESERRRSQKLESLGVLAGGLAHDFNNLLMGITGSISIARMHMERGDPSASTKPLAALEIAERACERARTLTHQLLTFARGGAPVKRTLNTRELIVNAVNFGLSGSNVNGVFSIPDGIWNIEADEHQLIQVISQIVLNGVEAMPGGGTLTVEVRNRQGDEEALPKVDQEKMVEVTIRDHGVGIPEEHMPCVFDPYFTAKKGGRGLGLAIVHSVVLKHGGHVKLDSKIGLGTAVTVLLPASAEPLPLDAELSEATEAEGSLILVMDDEEVVRQTISAMLEQLGHTVETAADGVEMLKRYRASRELGRPFDAVIMDLTIPGGMGGVEAIKELLAYDPSAVAIVSSGYSNDPVMANHRAYGFAGVVSKPYRAVDLRQALRQVRVGRGRR